MDALNRYKTYTKDEQPSDPVERLRAFCSFAMNGEDWLDLEPFINDVLNQRTELLREAFDDCIAVYERDDGHRQWTSVGTWLRPGLKVVVIDENAITRIVGADALDEMKEGQKHG